MKRTRLSRRQFALVAGAAGAGVAAEPLTAQAAIRRIQDALGGDAPASDLDGFKAGEPSTVVKGIATTAIATLDVLKQAVEAKTNLVLTYEPAFFGRADGRAPAPAAPGRSPAGFGPADPVVQAKREFIEKNGLVVYRLRDRWQARKQNEMVAGLAAALGWSAHRLQADDAIYQPPPATAEETVALIRRKLNLRGGLRAVGDRKAAVRRVLLHPGPMTPATMWQRYSEVDLVVAGEVREWENTHYAADMFTAGEKRALVTIGRVVSEDPGMHACAQWLHTVLPGIPATWIGAGDPYWRPA